MALREREERVEQTSHITWIYRGEGCAVYEVEHLFGYDLVFALDAGERLVPVRTGPLAKPMDYIDHNRARGALLAWETGNWGWMNGLLADLAARG
jgi:hypothetical protein